MGLFGDLDWLIDLFDDIWVDFGICLYIIFDVENEVIGDVKEVVFLIWVKVFDIKFGVL